MTDVHRDKNASEGEIAQLVDWALPIQARHLAGVREGSLHLAAAQNPCEG